MYNRNKYSGAYSRRRFSNASSVGLGSTSTAAGSSGTSFRVTTTANDRSMGDVEIQVISEPAGLTNKDNASGDRPPLSNYTPVGGRVFAKGTVILVKANPYNGYKFTSWQSAAYIPSSAHQSSSFQVTVNRDMTFIANFERRATTVNRKLSVHWDSSKGRVNANGMQDGQIIVPDGTQVPLAAVPKDAYVFSRWTGLQIAGNIQSNESSTITITMPNRDLSLTADFAQVVDNPGGGGGTPGGGQNKDTNKPISGGGGGGNGSDSGTDTLTEVTTTGGIVDKAVPFVKKWWWAIAIMAYLVWKERKGGSK